MCYVTAVLRLWQKPKCLACRWQCRSGANLRSLCDLLSCGTTQVMSEDVISAALRTRTKPLYSFCNLVMQPFCADAMLLLLC
jgi:hypothetical protein